jgi:recombinational DNA repair protein (RecF pathway)
MDRGDNNRYLSVLTAQRGRITLLAKGSHSLRGEQRAVSQLFTYANFEYYRNNKNKVDFKAKYTEEEIAEREKINKLLG